MASVRNILILCLWVLVSPLWAQTTPDAEFDYAAWETTAARAEGIIETASASSPALETLRATLADFRSQALKLQDVNQDRIDTLESQLAALGPVPAEGVVEADEVSQRRDELTDQLATARAPVLAAQEAYKRADGMIGEIDRIIRDRLADRLFLLGESPLDPSLWLGAVETVSGFVNDISEEVNESLASDARWVVTRRSLPISLGLILLGVLLITRARHWLRRGLGVIAHDAGSPMSDPACLSFSITRVLLPMLGLWAIIQGLEATGLVGLRGQVLMSAVPWIGFYIFGSIWLSVTLFNTSETQPIFFSLDTENARRGSRTTLFMGITLALSYLLERIATQVDFPESAHIVLSFPVVIIAGLLLIRLGLMLNPSKTDIDGPDVENPLQMRIYRLITRSIVVLGAAGPVLAAIGYFTASTSFVFPAIKTLALFGTVTIFYRLLNSLSETLLGFDGGKSKGADKPLTLAPVVLGFVLILAALPVLALIWGARTSDLMEVWTLASDGFTIGERRISVSDFLTFALVFAIGYTLTRLLQSTLRTTVLPRTNLDAGGRNAVLTGTVYVGIFLAAIVAITAAGLDLSSLAIVAGALSVGIGFGLQAIVSNFVSGIILLVERPIKEGDWIEVGSYSGYVRKISVRSTEIETFDKATVVVPNADFVSGTVTNYTHSNMNGRVKVPIGVAYGTDPRQVEQILLEIAEAHPMLDRRTIPSVVFMGFGADSMDFEIRMILKDVNWMLSVKSDINYEIVHRFEEAGIEIPFAQRDINLRNLGDLGETLQKAIKGKPS